MKFLFGIAFGALGMWAYHRGNVQRLTSNAPEPVQQAINTAAGRFNQVVTNDQVRQVASSVQDRLQRASGPEIVTPTAAEVAGRPAEPLPQ